MRWGSLIGAPAESAAPRAERAPGAMAWGDHRWSASLPAGAGGGAGRLARSHLGCHAGCCAGPGIGCLLVALPFALPFALPIALPVGPRADRHAGDDFAWALARSLLR